MKTLQLSTIVLLLSSAFFSCTREIPEPTKDAGASNALPNSKANAEIENFHVTSPVFVSDDVTVSGILHFDKAVNKFTATIEKATTGTANPDGTITWSGFQPTTYALDTTLPSNKWVTTMPFSFTFPASELGVSTTGWRLHISGRDAKSLPLGNATLEILPDPVVCAGLSLEGEVIGAIAPTDGSGLYTFTVQYTVNPCDLEFFMLKTQGGLTNGIEFIEAKDGVNRTPGHSTNKIITWIEGEKGGSELPGGNRTYTVKFRKAWDGASEIELTGNWSVSASLVGGGEVKAEFSSIIHK